MCIRDRQKGHPLGSGSMDSEQTRPLTRLVALSAITASLCCLPSVVWVMLAGSSAIVAADQLSNDLYYSWVRFALYLVSLSMLSYGLVVYFRNRGVCTLDDLKREKRRVVNTTLAVFTAAILTYLIWNFVILEIVGIAIGLPCLLYTSPSPRDLSTSRMPSSA